MTLLPSLSGPLPFLSLQAKDGCLDCRTPAVRRPAPFPPDKLAG